MHTYKTYSLTIESIGFNPFWSVLNAILYPTCAQRKWWHFVHCKTLILKWSVFSTEPHCRKKKIFLDRKHNIQLAKSEPDKFSYNHTNLYNFYLIYCRLGFHFQTSKTNRLNWRKATIMNTVQGEVYWRGMRGMKSKHTELSTKHWADV